MLRSPRIIKLFPLVLLAGCGGASTPAPQDTLLANEVPAAVTNSKSGDFQVDPATNLYWSNHVSVVLAYWEAEPYCKALGHDWRLPTIGELQSTFAEAGNSRVMKSALKRRVPKEGVLFSSEEIPRIDDQKQPWVVRIADGKTFSGHAHEGYARCVHGPKSRERKPFPTPPAKLMGEHWWEADDACPSGSIARGTPGRLVSCKTSSGDTNGRVTKWTSDGRSDTWYHGKTPHGKATKWNANGQKTSEVTYREGELHGQSTYWHANGEKASESGYANGKLHGRDVRWRPDGLQTSDLSYRAGQLHGRALYWHKNGEKASEATYLDGKLHGKTLKWTAEGLETSSISYRNGELHGRSTYWHPNGEKSSEASFVNGALHGKSVKWRPDGIRESESMYRNGKLHGLRTSWYPNGEKASVSAFANGKPHGKQTAWRNDGLKTSEKSYRNGSLHGSSILYFPNGEISSESTFADGLMHGVHQRWDERGNLLEKTKYVRARISEQLHYDAGTLRDGHVETEHPNGVSSYVGTFKEGRAQGKHYGYHPNGKQRFERNYNAKGILSGRAVDWHSNGKPREGSRYVRGALHGERVWYSPDGTVKARAHYKHGILVGK